MDGVSGASSAIAVVSLALQLADGCIKLYNFWSSIQDAPREVAVILDDLGHLSHMLHGISRNSHLSHDVAFGLKCCQTRISTLNGIVGDFEQDILSLKSKKRFWGSFKAVTKSKQLRLFRDSLADTKSTLLLALMQQSLQRPRLCFTLDDVRISEPVPPPKWRPGKQQQDSIGIRGEHETGQSWHIESEPQYMPPVRETNQITYSEINPPSIMIPSKMFQAVLKHSFQLALTDMFESETVEQLMSETIRRVNTFEVKCSGRYTSDEIDIRSRLITIDSDKRRTSDKGGSFIPGTRIRRSYVYHRVSSMEVLFGNLWIRRTNLSIEPSATAFSESFEIITTLIFHPASWLTRMGFHYGIEASLGSSIKGWRFNFKTVRAVPDNSLIFDLCERGDLIGVQRLLERCDASVFDRNSKGWTPLHFAAAYGHFKLCEALIKMGAEKAALAYEGPREDALSPITMFAASAQELHAEEKIGMLRLFAESLDLSDPGSDGWTVMCYLAQSYSKEKVPITNNSAIWMTRLTSTEPFIAVGPKTVWHAVQYVIRAFILHERNNRILQKLVGIQEGNGSVIMSHLDAFAHWLALRASQRELLPMIVEVGSILKMQGFDWKPDVITLRQFVRTLSAIYTAWAHTLPNSIDTLEHLIALELEELTQKLGWTHKSLLEAVSKREEEGQATSHYDCSECNDDYGRLGNGLVEPGWIAFNECTRTFHKFYCRCIEFLQDIRAMDEPTNVDGPLEDGYYDVDEKLIRDPKETISQLCEKYARLHIGDKVSDPLRDAATLLFQVQGRTWQGFYKPEDVLCATCFLRRELYIGKDGVGTEHDYAPMPESFYSTILTTI